MKAAIVTLCLVLLGTLIADAGAAEAPDQKLTVQLTVPDSAWKIAIDAVHQVKGEIWVVSTVSRDPDLMGAAVISTVTATVKLDVGDLPVKHFIIGKTWNWKNEEPYTFIAEPGACFALAGYLRMPSGSRPAGRGAAPLWRRQRVTRPAGWPRDVAGSIWLSCRAPFPPRGLSLSSSGPR